MEDFFSSSGGEESRFTRLGEMLAKLLQTLPENVQIFSVGDAGRRGEKELNVWFAAHGSPYYKAEKLHGYVAANKAKVSQLWLEKESLNVLNLVSRDEHVRQDFFKVHRSCIFCLNKVSSFHLISESNHFNILPLLSALALIILFFCFHYFYFLLCCSNSQYVNFFFQSLKIFAKKECV